MTKEERKIWEDGYEAAKKVRENYRIAAGTACFLVRDDSLYDMYGTFYTWLRENGFRCWDRKGHFDCCNWVFINLNSRVYAPGVPGLEVTTPIGGEFLTAEEFWTIYQIYERHWKKRAEAQARTAAKEQAPSPVEPDSPGSTNPRWSESAEA